MHFHFDQELRLLSLLQSSFVLSRWLLPEYPRQVPPPTLPFHLHQSVFWLPSTMTSCHTNTATALLSVRHEAPVKTLPIQADFSWSPFLTSLLFLLSSKVIISCSHFTFFVWTVTCCYLALKPRASEHAYLCAHPVIPFSSFQSQLTFVFSSWYSGHFLQSCFLLVCHMAVLVNPTRSILFAHCAFDVALSPPRFPVHWPPFAFFLIHLLSCFGFGLLAAVWEDFFYYCSWRNNVVVLFGTLKL